MRTTRNANRREHVTQDARGSDATSAGKKSRPGKSQTAHSEQVDEILLMLESFFPDDAQKARRWMDARNPLLGDQSPKSLIQKGLGASVKRFIDSRLAEITADSIPAESKLSATVCPNYPQPLSKLSVT